MGESRRFRFGRYEFDAGTGELRREGAPVRLQAQPAQLLACLLDRAGQVIPRDELRQAIWGSETFVDFDRGLNFAVSQVRAALRDDSAEPRFIRTLPKQGYQFIAPVERVSGAPAPAGPAPPVGEVRPTPRRGWLVAALVIGVAAAGAIWLRSRLAPASLPIVAVARFDNETDDPLNARISDALTDELVAQLTSASDGRYSVIGNALVLRQPREQRDLASIGTSLHAAYVVLGQLQSGEEGVRALVHLIRVSDQTHLCVARMEPGSGEPASRSSEAARRVAAEFAPSVAGNVLCPALQRRATP